MRPLARVIMAAPSSSSPARPVAASRGHAWWSRRQALAGGENGGGGDLGRGDATARTRSTSRAGGWPARRHPPMLLHRPDGALSCSIARGAGGAVPARPCLHRRPAQCPRRPCTGQWPLPRDIPTPSATASSHRPPARPHAARTHARLRCLVDERAAPLDTHTARAPDGEEDDAAAAAGVGERDEEENGEDWG
jgi:hypothetical protein